MGIWELNQFNNFFAKEEKIYAKSILKFPLQLMVVISGGFTLPRALPPKC